MVITHKMIEQGYSSSCSLPDSDRLQIAWYVNLSTCSGLMRLWFPCGTQKFLFLFKEMLRDIYASGGGGLDGGLFGSKAPRNKYNLSSFDTKEFVTDQEMCFFMHCNMQTDSVINSNSEGGKEELKDRVKERGHVDYMNWIFPWCSEAHNCKTERILCQRSCRVTDWGNKQGSTAVTECCESIGSFQCPSVLHLNNCVYCK